MRWCSNPCIDSGALLRESAVAFSKRFVELLRLPGFSQYHHLIPEQMETPSHFRKKQLGHLFCALGKLMGCIAIGALLAFAFPVAEGFFIAMSVLTGFSFARSEILNAKVAGHGARSAKLQLDMEDGRLPKHFILFLRGFGLDMKTTENPMRYTQGLEITTTEQQIAARLPAGHTLIAIGDPEEDVPKLGALRVYCDHHGWQEAVLKLMNDAAFIVMRPGDGPFLSWELEQIAERVGGEKFILCGYRAGMNAYAKFIRKHESILKIDPEPKRIPFFVLFNRDWTMRAEVF